MLLRDAAIAVGEDFTPNCEIELPLLSSSDDASKTCFPSLLDRPFPLDTFQLVQNFLCDIKRQRRHHAKRGVALCRRQAGRRYQHVVVLEEVLLRTAEGEPRNSPLPP